MKKTIVTLGLLAVLVTSCNKAADPYLVQNQNIGLLTDSTQVKDLKTIFINDSVISPIAGDEFTGALNTIEIYEKVSQHLQNKDFHIYNTKEFFSLALRYNFDEDSITSFLKGKVLDSIEEGLYFDNIVPNGYIGICHNCKVGNTETKMLVVGELSKDYEYFYNKISMV